MPHQMDDHHRSVDFFEALHNFEEKNKALHIHGKNANFYWGRCCIFMKKITSVGQRRCLIMAKKAVKLALKFSHAHISSITLPTGHPTQPVSSLLRKSDFSHYSCRRVPERKTNPVCKNGGKCLVGISVDCTGCRLQKCLR